MYLYLCYSYFVFVSFIFCTCVFGFSVSYFVNMKRKGGERNVSDVMSRHRKAGVNVVNVLPTTLKICATRFTIIHTTTLNVSFLHH